MATLQKYETEIAELYKTAPGDGIPAPSPTPIAESDQINGLVRECVCSALGRDISDEEDIFQAGADRLSV